MPENYTIQLYQRPTGKVAEEIVNLARQLTPKWFTANVPEDTRKDLLFQDAFCLRQDGRLVSFIVFTGWDGGLHITLFGTDPSQQNHGWGIIVLNRFCDYARQLHYTKIHILTVPPDIKPVYKETVQFYQNRGFVLTRRYANLWEHDAIELVKSLENPQEP
jgi:GNAT superfamily N-acetyltransferase